MSNLGLYQVMTTVAKKVGGPAILGLGTLAIGAGLGVGGDEGVRGLREKRKARISKAILENGTELNITGKYKDKHKLILEPGDTVRVLESDGESILIEKIGDKNNPYFIGWNDLKKII